MSSSHTFPLAALALLAPLAALPTSEARGVAATGAIAAAVSGPAVGDPAPAFGPHHVTGPDAGTRACPMCKYGGGQGVMVWVNADDLDGVAALAARLEKEIAARGLERMRAFVIEMNPGGLRPADLESRLEAFARRAGLRRVAVAWVPGPSDPGTSRLYRINPDPRVRTTVLVYGHRRVVDKFVNLPADPQALDGMMRAVDRAERGPRPDGSPGDAGGGDPAGGRAIAGV